MNVVSLTGNMTKAIEVRYSADNTAVGRFNLAVNRRKKGETDFISCVAFGKTAETIEKWTTKGMKIGVVGHIQTGSYEGKNGKVYTTDVIVDAFDFLEKKSEASVEPTSTSDFMDVPDGIDSELPFS